MLSGYLWKERGLALVRQASSPRRQGPHADIETWWVNEQGPDKSIKSETKRRICSEAGGK